MIIIVEGPERVGKTTLIRALRENFVAHRPDKPTLVIGSAAIDRERPLQSFHASYRYYDEVIALLLSRSDEFHFLLDRFHLGEYVYAYKYRNYSGDYVFNLERNWVEAIPEEVFKDTKLIVLSNNYRALMMREDGKSLTNTLDAKVEEIEAFHRGYHRSKLHKFLLDCEALDVAEMISTARGFIDADPEDL